MSITVVNGYKQKTLHRVLVPVDYSNDSDTAILFAFRLAKERKYEIRFLHVHDTDRKSETEYDDSIRTIVLEDYIKDYISNVRGFDADHIYSCSAVQGIPSEKIIDAAGGADLVIMGLKGAGQVTRTFMGGTAWKVISLVGCPVMLIPHDAVYKGFRKVVFATDFRYRDIGALQMISAIAPGAVVKAVHAGNHIAKSALLSWFIQKAKENVFDIGIVPFIIKDQDVIPALARVIDEDKPDLVSFCATRKSLIGNIYTGALTGAMMGYSGSPLLIFRDPVVTEEQIEL